MKFRNMAACASAAGVLAAIGTAVPAGASTAGSVFLHTLHSVTQLASTVPADGDVNPYGVAVVPSSEGSLVAGDTLVSNFNAKSNVQGTGTTIEEVSPGGTVTPFAQLSHLGSGLSCPGGIGLTTALTVLPDGWVVVGSLPTAAKGALPKGDPAGCLIVLADTGTPVETIANHDIVGPWDMTSSVHGDRASLFVSDAFGGNTSTDNGVPVAGKCNVVRVTLALGDGAPQVLSTTVIGSGFPWRANSAALVLAPTGLALGPTGTLYVDDTETDSIAAIPDAPTRRTSVDDTHSITSGGWLDAPLGMALAPNGDLLVVNGNNGDIVEVTPQGKQLVKETLVAKGAGDLFGLALSPNDQGILFVNDGTNALDVLGGDT